MNLLFDDMPSLRNSKAYLIFPLLLVIFNFLSCNSFDDPYHVEGIPDGYDAWCKENCRSFRECSDKFGHDFIDLRIKVNFSIHNGPGQSFISGVFMGDTISRQSFQSQFIFDVSNALDISPCRLYVLNIESAKDHFSSEHSHVLISFRFFPADIHKLRTLTMQIQKPDSKFYTGKVTIAADRLYGLVTLKWDFSLRLTFSIYVIGEKLVQEQNGILYLNQGSEGFCQKSMNLNSSYCEFERFFCADLASSLLMEENQIKILFIKSEGRDKVLIFFRFIPLPNESNDALWINIHLNNLLDQVNDINSKLYMGNVTVRIDQTWGVSGYSTSPRKDSKFLPYSRMKTTENKYERCKQTQRCARGWSFYDQKSSSLSTTMQSFAGGYHYEINLFNDFEDWRQGTHGWNYNFDKKLKLSHLPDGSHFSPFEFESLGPTIPSFNNTSNNGLVLNKKSLASQITKQRYWVDEIKDYIRWQESNIEVATLDAKHRSRSDVKRAINETKNYYLNLLANETSKLLHLSKSQCANISCTLIFNTSSLEVNGAINATGKMGLTPDGTEIAIWTFDSIDIAEEVDVVLTGQRAIALLSRSSINIDTKLVARPGTLGGFPGGYSVARVEKDRWIEICYEKRLKSHQRNRTACSGDQPLEALATGIRSYNVNGPGSGSVRVILKTMEIKAPIVKEIIELKSSTQNGQILSGGFKLHFNGYSTALIPYDVSSKELKKEMEESLNAFPFHRPVQYPENRKNTVPGIGIVNVSRKSFGISGGYIWRMTFESAIGNIGKTDSKKLEITNLLHGIGATLKLETLVHGNTIAGTFKLQFSSYTTQSIPHDISAHSLQLLLLKDIPLLKTVDVLRTDPTSNDNCNDGFCQNGPNQAGGYIWTLTLTTLENNLSPPSPTSHLGFNDDLQHYVDGIDLTVAENNLTGCVEYQCPSIIIADGHGKSHLRVMKDLLAPKPFSFSYGGAGAGYGGKGGEGFGKNEAGRTYGDHRISNLYGGSGGALGFTQPYEANIFSNPWGRGGSGGGAIELVAQNDIVIGPNAFLSCKGENGHDGFMTAGGGGSGGSILISASGIVRHEGTILVNGGNGGKATQPKANHHIEDGHGGGGGGGRVAMYGLSVIFNVTNAKKIETGSINVNGGICAKDGVLFRNRDCDGKLGTIYKKSLLHQYIFIDNSKGAAGTKNSLYLKNHETINTSHMKYAKLEKFSQKTAHFDLQNSQIKNERPGRVTFFVALGLDDEKYGYPNKDKRGFSFELLGIPVKNHANVIIGIFVGKDMRHGANYSGIIGDTTYSETLDVFLSETKMERDKWYYLDIRLNWVKHTYDIYLDHVLVCENSPFSATITSVESIAIGNFHASAAVWIDELYIGKDTTMGFKCPVVDSTKNRNLKDINGADKFVKMKRPIQTGWQESDIGGPNLKQPMTRHNSHLSRRSIYNRPDNGGLMPFDGESHNAYVSDVKYSFGVSGDRQPGVQGKFSFGPILTIPSERVVEEINSFDHGESDDVEFYSIGSKHRPQYIWYGEHDGKNDLQDEDVNAVDGRVDNNNSETKQSTSFLGGVSACSTTNFRTWKNEGIMLNYVNITDMVNDSSGPFHVERPKVLYNSKTKQYVMWMMIDNKNRSLGMAGVAVSDYPTGPFDFVRSLYPDGNQTKDQTIVYGSETTIQKEEGTGEQARPAYLIRTYYATVEYVLPSAIMQPIWESVKNKDGEINFALSYHRANYEPDYDNFHDIYLQRWRKEDTPWKVICIHKQTGIEREVPYGKDHLNWNGDVCDDSKELKQVIGQASPRHENSVNGIKSRYLDPDDPDNSVWKPNSVPSVRAQPWSANYRDGSCGIQKDKDLDMQRLDPSLAEGGDLGGKLKDRKHCSNIADNPIHGTPPDKLIGPKRVVERRRAKFVAISRLTDDYLDTSGILMSFEGELDNEQDLISLIENQSHAQSKSGGGINDGIGGFGWSSGEELGSTYKGQIESEYFQTAPNWDTRFHQYEKNYNDRATYSTACVLDGQCPVNFRDQIIEGDT